MFEERKRKVDEQPKIPSEETLDISPSATVINLGKLPPINQPLDSSEKLDMSQFKISALESDDIVFYGDHAFFNGLLSAFKMHKSITLSPDMIWLLIVQGFSYHVAANSEKLRTMFVSFEGKKDLVVKRQNLTPETATTDDWMGIIDEFVGKIDENTKDHIALVLEPKFSTTTPVSHTAGMASIMSAMKHYFDYRVIMCVCGFPSITIEGIVEDWELIKQKTEALAKYDLEWWTSKLIPIIDEFINARKGNCNFEFWHKMIRLNGGRGPYDPSFIDGWICTFYPYDRYGSRNGLGSISGSSKLPSEILDTPFILEHLGPNGLMNVNCELDSGFMGVNETKIADGVYNVRPIIGWGYKYDVPKKEKPKKNERFY